MARTKKQRSKKPRAAKSAARSRIATKLEESAEIIVVADSGAAIDIEQQASSASLMLPDCLDSDASVAVRDMLLQRRGQPLVVDASQVRRVGAQSLQILIAAARTWQADGLSYALTKPSSELLETMALVGMSQSELLLEGTTP